MIIVWLWCKKEGRSTHSTRENEYKQIKLFDWILDLESWTRTRIRRIKAHPIWKRRSHARNQKKMSVIDQHRRLGIETNPPTTNESRTRQNLSTLAASMGYTKKIERKDRIGEEKDREDPTSMATTTKNERKKRRGGDGEDVPTWLLFFFPLAFRARGWAAR